MPLVTFVRHGESLCNEALLRKMMNVAEKNDLEMLSTGECSKRHGGNPALTLTGERQAKEAGKHLVDQLLNNIKWNLTRPEDGFYRNWKKHPPRCLFLCSDLDRAVQTANLALAEACKHVRWMKKEVPFLRLRPDLREHTDREEDTFGLEKSEYNANLDSFVIELQEMEGEFDHVFVFCHSNVMKSIWQRMDNQGGTPRTTRLSVFNGGLITIKNSPPGNLKILRLFEVEVEILNPKKRWWWQQ